jgi:hypothetical protein
MPLDKLESLVSQKPGEGPKLWTVVAYIVADDVGEATPEQAAHIDDVAQKEAEAIQKAVGALDAHVAIQLDFKGKRGVHRWMNGEKTELPEGPSGDPRHVNGFMSEVALLCPSRHRLVLFWGHGAGPIGMFHDDNPTFSSAQKTLSLRDMRSALEILGHVNIFVVKSCSMATLEAAWELDGAVDYLIASQGNVSEQPWTYPHIVAALKKVWGDDMESVARNIVDALHRHYATTAITTDDEVPFAVLRLAGVAEIRRELQSLVRALAIGKRFATLGDEREKAFEDARPDPPPWEPSLIDVTTMCEHLLLCQEFEDEARAVMTSLRERLIRHRQPQNTLFRGVSLFHYPRDGSGDFAEAISPADYLKLRLCADLSEWPSIAFEHVIPPVVV